MRHLIKEGRILEPDGMEMLSLTEFLAAGDPSQPVWLDADEEVESLASCVETIPVIGLNFPAFMDGRAYSSAALLRQHYRFAGEIRAIGDVRIDQLEQMIRCGFNAFQLAEGQDASMALQKLSGFPWSYQQTADRQPLFRNREQ